MVLLTAWQLWLCTALMSYQLLIPWGPTTNNHQQTLLGLLPLFASFAPHAWIYTPVAWFIFTSPPSSYSWNNLEYSVLREREEGKDEKVYMINQQTKKNEWWDTTRPTGVNNRHGTELITTTPKHCILQFFLVVLFFVHTVHIYVSHLIQSLRLAPAP